MQSGRPPSYVLDDAPVELPQVAGDTWQPRNYDLKFEGPMIMRRALEYTRMFDMPVIDHCEDASLKGDGVAHEGAVAGLPLGERWQLLQLPKQQRGLELGRAGQLRARGDGDRRRAPGGR